MTETESAHSEPPRRAAVVIPLRSLHAGKLRLREALSDDERAELIRTMAETVVRAAHDLPVLVVHDDPGVADWAHGLGADSIPATKPGLNRAVAQGFDVLRARGFDDIVVAHADLPRASDLRVVLEFAGITIVPDRLRDGTNVLCVPAIVDFDFSYGPGSFETHLRLANESGLPVRVLHDEDLAWDIDHYDDLTQMPPIEPFEL